MFALCGGTTVHFQEIYSSPVVQYLRFAMLETAGDRIKLPWCEVVRDRFLKRSVLREEVTKVTGVLRKVCRPDFQHCNDEARGQSLDSSSSGFLLLPMTLFR